MTPTRDVVRSDERGDPGARDEGDWGSWSGLRTLAASVVAVPVVAGFIALGAGVIVGRSLLDVARVAWRRVPSRTRNQRDPKPS